MNALIMLCVPTHYNVTGRHFAREGNIAVIQPKLLPSDVIIDNIVREEN